MENKNKERVLKLNYKRTFTIGFAFFGILLLWQVYDSWCPTLLTELFKKHLTGSSEKEVQYLVGIMMAMDNLFALFLLPVFGYLSDRTHTKIGKRMPYILMGTLVCAIAFPFIPVFYEMNSVFGVIAVMAVVLIFAMMYRNPAVALMPDITPKPLRSKANGIINIMGYIGGAFATVVGIFFSLSKYLGKNDYVGWETNNIWALEAPFLVGSVLMVISAIFLFIKIKENDIAEQMKEEMEEGEKLAATEDKLEEDKPLSKANKRMLLFILGAEFFWFMADNAVSTFMGNYTLYYLLCNSSSNMINTIIMGVGSVVGFAFGGTIAEKIGRKWTLFIGLGITALAYLAWGLLATNIPTPASGEFNKFPVYLYAVFFVKGLGMSLVHVNSFPMVVELATGKSVGKFTGYYYAASMAAQTLTPCLLGLLLLIPNFGFDLLPIYALICTVAGLVIFFFVKNVKVGKSGVKKGLEAFDQED